MRGFVILFLLSGLLACKRAANEKPVETAPAPGPNPTTTANSPATHGPQVKPPFDLKTPPADVTKTASGLIYKKTVSSATGVQPKRNDTVLVKFSGWRQSTGETLYTSEGGGQAMPLNLAQSAIGFVEALQLLRVGEKAVFWMPPEIGFKDMQSQDQRETRVYQIEVVEVQPAPPIPDDVGKPPDSAKALPSGIKFVVVRPGTEKEKIRMYDTPTFRFTAWDRDGRMLDTTETRKLPKSIMPYKQGTGMSEMLTSMTVGERTRFWVDAEKMLDSDRKPGDVKTGILCYEVEVTKNKKAEHEPPPTPPDVSKPPGDAKKTPKGTFYRLLAAGPGKDPRHPTENDSVKVNYTGWTTDGKMFDSSFMQPTPAVFNLRGVVAGWTDGIPLMTTGDRMRFWIPEELAYKGQAGKPKGMLVFDVELLEIQEPNTH